jgi:HEAT repeat protein
MRWRRLQLARVVALCLLAAAIVHARPARADDVADLAQLLASSSSDKQRLSAVLSLARLGDRRTLKPLVGALHDPNARIRAIAAAALGHLAHKAALPALRAAADDPDPVVRTHARQAALAVAKANNLPADLPDDSSAPEPTAPATATADAAATPAVARHGKGRPGFGHQPRAVDARPDLYVLIKSSSDDSPGKQDKDARKVHADLVRQVLFDSFKATPQVTTVAADAQRWGLDPRHIDLSVVKMEISNAGGFVEVDAELRLAISDDTGKMLSFLSGGAKVSVPRRSFDPKFLPELRKEALENAMRGMFDKLLAHLRTAIS